MRDCPTERSRSPVLAALVGLGLLTGLGACAEDTASDLAQTQGALRRALPPESDPPLPPPPPPPDCLDVATATMTANPSAVMVGDTPPAGLTSYVLGASFSGRRRTLATVPIRVKQFVHITANDQVSQISQVSQLIAALGQANTTILVDDAVAMDLSDLRDIFIAEGVSLLGGRTSNRPGPLFFTSTRPDVLFELTGNDVTIRGVRIAAPDVELQQCVATLHNLNGVTWVTGCVSNTQGI